MPPLTKPGPIRTAQTPLERVREASAPGVLREGLGVPILYLQGLGADPALSSSDGVFKLWARPDQGVVWGAMGTQTPSQMYPPTGGGGGGGVTVHSLLSGLGAPADDHTQYAELAGRTGTTNDITISSDGTGTLRGSAASAGVLRIIATSHATPGVIRAINPMLIGQDASPTNAILEVSGGTVSPGVGANARVALVVGTLVEAGSGTHAIMAGLELTAPTITAGAAAVTVASTLYVSGAPSASGAVNYALYIPSGDACFGPAPASITTASPRLLVKGWRNLGSGIANLAQINFVGVSSATGGQRIGITVAGSYDLAGFNLTNTAGGSVIGVESIPDVTDTVGGGILSLHAAFSGGLVFGTGGYPITVIDSAQYFARAYLDGSGGLATITTHRGLWIRNQGHSTMTLVVGIHIEAQSGATNNRSLWVQGSAPSIHEPPLLVGANQIPASGVALEVNAASVVASSNLVRGSIGAEANPRWALGFDASSLVQLGLGSGGATPLDIFLKRSAARSVRLVSNSSTLPPTLGGGMTSTDTQPRWLLQHILDNNYWAGTRPRFSLGPAGATAVDTHLERTADAGVLFLKNILGLQDITSQPTLTNVSQGATVGYPSYLYCRTPSGVIGNTSRVYYASDTGSAMQEIGPLGLLRGLLQQFTLPFGGMETYDGNGAGALTGVNCWGLLGTPEYTSGSSTDAAYSPALSLTNNITATATSFTVTGGLPLRGDSIVIDAEKIQVIYHDGASTVLSCIRGAYGTTPSAHSAGAAILLAGGSTKTLLGADGEPALEMDTGTTSGTDAALVFPGDVGYISTLHSAQLLVYKFDLRNVTNIRLFLGFTDQTRTTMLAADNPAGQYWGLSFSSARGDTAFMAVSKDGTTQNLVSTGWAGHPAAGTKYYIRLQFDGGGDNPRLSLFDSSWTQIGATAQLTANIPSLDATGLRIVAGIRNLAAASKRMRHEFASLNLSPSVA